MVFESFRMTIFLRTYLPVTSELASVIKVLCTNQGSNILTPEEVT